MRGVRSNTVCRTSTVYIHGTRRDPRAGKHSTVQNKGEREKGEPGLIPTQNTVCIVLCMYIACTVYCVLYCVLCTVYSRERRERRERVAGCSSRPHLTGLTLISPAPEIKREKRGRRHGADAAGVFPSLLPVLPRLQAPIGNCTARWPCLP